MLASKLDQSYCHTINWLKCRLSCEPLYNVLVVLNLPEGLLLECLACHLIWWWQKSMGHPTLVFASSLYIIVFFYTMVTVYLHSVTFIALHVLLSFVYIVLLILLILHCVLLYFPGKGSSRCWLLTSYLHICRRDGSKKVSWSTTIPEDQAAVVTGSLRMCAEG